MAKENGKGDPNPLRVDDDDILLFLKGGREILEQDTDLEDIVLELLGDETLLVKELDRFSDGPLVPLSGCQVCGVSGSGEHNYYGGQCCNSCRAFFRRAVRSDSHRRFVCKMGSNECNLNSKSWKSCQRCRFNKCLNSGMRPSWVREDTRYELRKLVTFK